MSQAKQVEIITNKGIILIELNEEKAPKTVANFLAYVASGHYADTIFHRVISNFMIQGGGLTEGLQQKPVEAAVENEAKNGLKNDKYTIAMARTTAPHSATAQFFINTKANDFLNYPGQDGWGYAVFGKVIAGESIVDEIESVQTGRHGMHSDVPKDPIVIKAINQIQFPVEHAGNAPAEGAAATGAGEQAVIEEL